MLPITACFAPVTALGFWITARGGYVRTAATLIGLAGRAWLTEVLQTVLLYWLILPQGVLFSR